MLRAQIVPFFLATLAATAVAERVDAQSIGDLAIEAVHAVKQSALARDWRAAFATAPAGDVLASFIGLKFGLQRLDGRRDSLPDSSVTRHKAQIVARLNARPRDEGFRIVADNWDCAALAEYLQPRCALKEVPYYVVMAGIQQRGDTSAVYVSVAARGVGSQPDVVWLSTVVRLVPEGVGWRVVRVDESKR